MIEKIKKKLIALLQSFLNLLQSLFVKKNKLSYDEKLRLALENDDLIYEEMHEEYEIPYSKKDLIVWRIKNYVKSLFHNIPSLLLWTLISFVLTTGISYLYRCVIEPFLEKKSWNYLNIIREKVIYLYPYIFGDDALGTLFDKFGSGYVKGFDEPWQFIYRRYDHWYDTGTIGGATEEWVAIGIFSIFFTFALFGLIGMIVSKIRSTGVKSLFVDLIKIPKTVYEYGKRSKQKVLDHFLAGIIISFIAGFFIKNPVAMPLFGLTLLISFTMKQDSDKAFSHYAKECAQKKKDDEEKPLFADSALYCWGLGTGFLFYSYVGYVLWNEFDFCFNARLFETLIWTVLAFLIYVIRNGRKSTKVVAQSLFAVFGAISGVMMCPIIASARIIRIFYDNYGNKIGQLIQFEIVCTASSESSFGTALRNGLGGGLGGANDAANMAKRRKAARDAGANGGKKAGKNRIDKSRGVNTEMGRLRTYRDIIMDGRSLDELTPTERAEVDRINKLISDSKHGKVSNTDYEEQAAALKEVAKKVARGDLSDDVNKTKSNAQINADAAKDSVGNGFEEMSRGETLGAKIARTTTGIASGGYSEAVFAPAGAMYKAQDMVNEGRSAEDVTSTIIIDSSIDLVVNEATGKVMEGGVKLSGTKLPTGAQSVDQLGEFKTILQNSDIDSQLGRAALTYQTSSSVASGVPGEMLSEAAQNAAHDLINNTDGSNE